MTSLDRISAPYTRGDDLRRLRVAARGRSALERALRALGIWASYRPVKERRQQCGRIARETAATDSYSDEAGWSNRGVRRDDDEVDDDVVNNHEDEASCRLM